MSNNHRSKNSHKKRVYRLQAFKRQKGLCHFCRVPMWMPFEGCAADDRMATLEHLRDLENGGDWHVSNLACTCLSCNKGRAHAKHTGRNWTPQERIYWNAVADRKTTSAEGVKGE